MKLFFLFLSVIIFCSCNNKYENYIKQNTSEIREYLCVGESDNISASLILGKREKNYIVNGYSSEFVEFGVITFDIGENEEIDRNSSKFILFVGTNRFEGDLQENPFDKTLVADIGKIVDINNNITARLISNNYEKDIQLIVVNKDWKINSDDVYNIISKNMKEEIKTFVNNNNFEGEVYIKIINDFDKNIEDYYWFVNIVGRKGNRMSMILSPKSGEILASNSYL